ncbi:pepsin-like aspartic protease [Aspergillus ibericus CBS 121593]|uniref:Acid protease n=1 Tax=Aspergillus ibericus CBS 121593 TaxID=1448316 RepID=A0A395GXD3_9EURO|nr:acid protease [Aspergillus ibericus CBS 121593]RAL00010.1 acid protease [Aspergillus ibericus CBS 121593]
MQLLHLSSILPLLALTSALTIPLNRRSAGPSHPNSFTHSAPLLSTQYGTVFDIDVTIATNQTFRLLVDTGSSDTYVMRDHFACINATSNLVIPQADCLYASSTYTISPTYQQIPNETFGVKYGNGLASGVMAYENITIGGVDVRAILGIADVSNPMGDGYNSGVFGLGYPSLTSAHPGNFTANTSYWTNRAVYNPVFNTMYAQGLVEPWFSIALAHTPPQASGPEFGGYLGLGELPPVPHSEEFSVAPVEIMDNIPLWFTSGKRARSYWALTVAGTRYGYENACPMQANDTAFQAFLDTGNEFSYLPAAVVNPVNALFSPPAVYNKDLGVSLVDCDAQAPAFGVVIGNQTFYHRGKDLIYNTGEGYCASILVASETVALDGMVLNILGMSFMKNVVSVFDFGANEMRSNNDLSGEHEMKFYPTPEEQNGGVTHIDDQPCDLNSTKLAVSGSDWGEMHLKALRVVLLDGLPMPRLFPSEFIPAETHGALDLLKPDEDCLKEFSVWESQFRKNPFCVLFGLIAEVMATRPANVPGTPGYTRNPSPGSGLSSSSNEGKQEEPSRQMFTPLLRNLTGSGYPSIQYQGQAYSLQMNTESRAVSISLGTETKCLAYNDGGIYLTRQGHYTGSDRYGTIPLMSLEVHLWLPNVVTPEVFAGQQGKQKGIRQTSWLRKWPQLLGQAMEHAAQLDGWRDQEAFVLTIHGTHLKLAAAHFTAECLRHANSPVMPGSETLWVRRSEPYDLKSQRGRAGALQLCIGVYEHLRSGRAEIGLLQKIFE